ncbi:GNAT family N-acetyltransferase [Sporosarcina sp. ANT_H38]|uniref:GNAT family N-acetyltransferase n=1 Tax=Sporosarcina sp. ANT_H38 TaxID=2597358 RepID=UPI0011F3DC25|nr:GNAT family N-acetyltransferase [Sporosarcina sp. ANT_H38]KAA0966344.1 GNAT family N-acetyltransferase [Sporosarcina sp. ANT_H38]
MRLVRPSVEWKNEHEDYIKEWEEPRMTPSSFNLAGYENYDAYLETLKIRGSGDGKWVPSTNYFLVDENDRVLAMVDIRHELSDYLHNVGGHIGYSVRPTERRKGYATRILAEALKKCDVLGIRRVLVTCNDDNIGSAKTIVKNGGVEDKSFAEEDGTVVRRFWIES